MNLVNFQSTLLIINHCRTQLQKILTKIRRVISILLLMYVTCWLWLVLTNKVGRTPISWQPYTNSTKQTTSCTKVYSGPSQVHMWYARKLTIFTHKCCRKTTKHQTLSCSLFATNQTLKWFRVDQVKNITSSSLIKMPSGVLSILFPQFTKRHFLIKSQWFTRTRFRVCIQHKRKRLSISKTLPTWPNILCKLKLETQTLTRSWNANLIKWR